MPGPITQTNAAFIAAIQKKYPFTIKRDWVAEKKRFLDAKQAVILSQFVDSFRRGDFALLTAYCNSLLERPDKSEEDLAFLQKHLISLFAQQAYLSGSYQERTADPRIAPEPNQENKNKLENINISSK